MNQGSSDRVPASSLIFFASITYTLVTFSVFKLLWEIPLPVYLLIAVLGLQLAALLLGSSKILTQLGAASLAALVAMLASIASVFFLFPPLLEMKVAGGVGGITALVFILASFVAASREDPLPSQAPHNIPEPLFLGEYESMPSVELIKYGEVRAPDAADIHDLPLADTAWEDEIPEEQSAPGEDLFPPMETEDIYEFDELSESKMGKALGADDSGPPSDSLDHVEDGGSMEDDGALPSEVSPKDLSDDEPVTGAAITDDWVEEAARVMAYDFAGQKTEDLNVRAPEADGHPDIMRADAERVPDFRMRTRYKVLDEASGEHYGTYFGDEGYSTLDLISLSELLSPKRATGELRIVKLDWSNFDEVEVHVKVDEVVAMKLDVDVKDDIDEARILSGEESQLEVEAVSGSEAAPPVDEPAAESEEEEAEPAVNPSGPRYMIYDRRTIQPMGEYVPEGDRSRIDRLALYKMFPEYDFKTFEIDSIRWEADEVRILIRGEKKDKKSV